MNGATAKINEEEPFSVFSEILECKYFNAIKSVLMHPESTELNQSIQKKTINTTLLHYLS